MDKNANVSKQMKELIRYATLAANGHNTQPWNFSINGGEIIIKPDFSRRLPAVDPHDRELWISLGCALENLLIAAHASGYITDLTYPSVNDSIFVHLTRGIEQKDSLHDAISFRQNTRSVYNGQAITVKDFESLKSMPGEPGISLHFFDDRNKIERIVEYIAMGDICQFSDKGFLGELIHWLRFNKKEAISSLDGLFSRCSGNPEVPRWLGEIFLTTMNPRQQADNDVMKVRSSSGVVIITSEADDKTSWVRCGQVYERLALTMTTMDIRSSFMNQPIEVESLREEFQSAMGLGLAHPQLLLRFGYANLMPYALRRAPDKVLL